MLIFNLFSYKEKNRFNFIVIEKYNFNYYETAKMGIFNFQ